jgi:hypothetical protein
LKNVLFDTSFNSSNLYSWIKSYFGRDGNENCEMLILLQSKNIEQIIEDKIKWW